MLTILGFSDGDRTRPVEALSGGWPNRAALARILLQQPDVLLLDEPTNYLDVEGLEWLEGWLQRFRGAVVVVSHDRHFLDQVIEQTIEIENLRFHVYDGNFTQYVREKPLRLKPQEKQFLHEAELLDDLDLDDTVTHAVNAMPDDSLARLAPRKQVNRFLTLFQFSEMDQKQRIRTLSGGQRARVALAQCLLSGATTIILDEPTNHLDVTSTQVMERALTAFPGAVVVVSHDRFFLDKVVTRRLTFDGEGRVSMR